MPLSWLSGLERQRTASGDGGLKTLLGYRVEFRADDEAAAYRRYAGALSQADLERVFFLDDENLTLVDRRRGEHARPGFALQLVTVRWLGTFLEDPPEGPGAVLDFAVGQLGMSDPSQVRV